MDFLLIVEWKIIYLVSLKNFEGSVWNLWELSSSSYEVKSLESSCIFNLLFACSMISFTSFPLKTNLVLFFFSMFVS